MACVHVEIDEETPRVRPEMPAGFIASFGCFERQDTVEPYRDNLLLFCYFRWIDLVLMLIASSASLILLGCLESGK